MVPPRAPFDGGESSRGEGRERRVLKRAIVSEPRLCGALKKEARLQPLIFRWKKHAEAVFIDGLHVSLVW